MTESFWILSSGQIATGSEKDAHVNPFTVIPDGTQAIALIKDFIIDVSQEHPFYKVTYKLSNGDYQGREVIQKIKCFDPKQTIADRAINMLKRIFMIFSYMPPHDEAPKEDDILKLKGRTIGIKIAEWSLIKDDGTVSEGNYISEVHPIQGFEVATGVKATARPRVESAFSRTEHTRLMDDDLSKLNF